jgi:6-phosphogluconolactonase
MTTSPLWLARPTAIRLRFALMMNMALGLLGCATAGPSQVGESAAATPTKTPLVYVSGSHDIGIYRLDVAGATLLPLGKSDGGDAPSYLAFHPQGRALYAVNNDNNGGKVAAFSLERTNGALKALGSSSSMGRGPAHLSVDGAGRWVLVANYASSSDGVIAVLPILADGSVGPAVSRDNFGHNAYPHLIITDPANRFAFVPCKGRDMVVQLRFDSATGKLTRNNPDNVRTALGSGPRHLTFHPNGKLAFLINELDSTMTSFRYDAETGRLSEIHSVSTLPSGFRGKNTGADVHVHPSGRFVYGSNRGHDSIAIFAIDEATGEMTALGHEMRTIKTPRNFHIDPAGKLMFVASQGADTITLFRIKDDGLLEQAGAPIDVVAKPSFVGVLQ